MVPYVNTIPNCLSIFRLIAGLVIVEIFFFKEELGSFFELTWISFYVVACLSDFLDGIIARSFPSQGSDFGKIIDPISDKVFAFFVMGTIYFSGKIESWEVVCMVLIIFREVLVLFVRKPFIGDVNILKVSNTGKWKTVFQMISFVFLLSRGGVIAGYFDQTFPYLLFDKFGSMLLFVATSLTIYSGYGYFQEWRLQNKQG